MQDVQHVDVPSQPLLSSVAPSTLTAGPCLAIGGAEDKMNDRSILATFLQLAGGHDARIAIVPTASSMENGGERYRRLFTEMGAPEVSVVPIMSREDANGGISLEPLHRATGIFLTGGNQMRLSAMMGGSEAEDWIRQRHQAGAIVAGTSAGASILSAHMVAMGASGPSPRLRMAQMVAGFGLVPDMIIDQHFRQRDRIGRLLALVAANPSLLGVGIDEDTGILIDERGVMEVIGRQSITIVDGRRMVSDIAEVKAQGGISVSNANLHVLTAGRRFFAPERRIIDWY
ncbi:MAG: Cyanophycinase [uncultured Thermomicrobiales bacterium]|uniref:Cyanophycinase n=1 Tax=uncultured Thermomicrobiales bacterium TaxID=1645740 RepID=A0A6J4V9A6_9BACT|nr:MAG: Cyanophycinase [uncultured Thermomicrobiales bacterium]